MEELQGLLYQYRNLVKDIIETLDGRDDSVKEWIEEQVKEIEE